MVLWKKHNFSHHPILLYTYGMYLKSVELIGFKSFGKKSMLEFTTPITAIVGPNGSGKSNTAEAFRFVLGEQSIKSLRGKRGEDLIWGGSTEVSRANRATVRAVFDNSKRLLDIDFDEVAIERTVYRDGTNEYMINGSKVRLKDIIALLAGANIGFSGHHIISQGEADRIISASSRERRQMIEDALGLRVYQNKKEESLKKLEHTEENKVQVEALRRENTPHLRFLERQVKKIEKARVLREDLVAKYHEYLFFEEQYLKNEKKMLDNLRNEPTARLKETEQRIMEVRSELEHTKKGDKESEELLALNQSLDQLRNQKNEYIRSIGRIEGQITFEERRLEEEKRKSMEEEGRPVPYKHAKSFLEDLAYIIGDAPEREDPSIRELQKVLKNAKKILTRFIDQYVVKKVEYTPDLSTLEDLQKEKEKVNKQAQEVSARIEKTEQSIQAMKEAIEKEKDDSRDLERELFALMNTQTQLKATLSTLESREVTLRRDEDEFKHEIGEGVVLIGRAVQEYKDYSAGEESVSLREREEQLKCHRELEKMKIRLEELGGAATEEILTEYREVRERDEFLEGELNDLDQSAERLQGLISDLDHELSEKFKQGLEEISAQFNEFFVLMFGGGGARLTVVNEQVRKRKDELLETEGEDEEETALGVDVEVSLPKKRIQSLMMLSGGERALTSIALIFAMSQVNPPPFLILDETDAALDEANSKRYGDMIENLSKKSQLILITHNRDTMSRANILYGITMGADGVSRILSVKFDDAVAVAK